MKRLRLTVRLGLVCLLAGAGPALADTTNYWTTNSVGSYSGIFTEPEHWSLGVPTAVTTNFIFFTNQQTTAYSVQLTNSVTTGRLAIYNDSVTFDLNGYKWSLLNNYPPVNDAKLGVQIGTNVSYAMTVTFSSTSPTNVIDGNVADLGNSYYTRDTLGASRNTRFVVDDSLGYPVKVIYPISLGGLMNADILVSGTNSELAVNFAYNGANPTIGANLVVSNQAVFRAQVDAFLWGSYNGKATATFYNSTLHTPKGTSLGVVLNNSEGTIILNDGSAWYDGGTVQLGGDPRPGGGPYKGTIILDNSTFVGSNVIMGAANGTAGFSPYFAPGRILASNGSSLTISNGVTVTPYHLANATNTFQLGDSEVALGGGAVGGFITNYGITRVTRSTIRGQGAVNALVYNGSINGTNGVLDLRDNGQLINVNLDARPNSVTYFEFTETGLSQVLASNGFVRLEGTNVFSLAGDTSSLAPGVKWGLGVYRFALGTNVTWNPQYVELTNVLASYGLVQNLDYRFGLVDLAGGWQALQLEFVPEPSTVLLLLGGALLLWRWPRRRG